MRNLLDTLISLILMSILIVGIISGIALVTPISSIASESIQYSLNTMTNYIRGGLHPLVRGVYTTVLTAAYIIDTVITALSLYKMYKETKKSVSLSKTLYEVKEYYIENELKLSKIEKAFIKSNVKSIERFLLKSSLRWLFLVPGLAGYGASTITKIIISMSGNEYVGVVPHEFDRDEATLAAISGISSLIVEKSLPEESKVAIGKTLAYLGFSSISVSLGLDLFMDFVVRDTVIKTFDVFYNPIITTAEKKEDIFKRIDGCYKMFGSGDLKTQYLRPNPLLVYMIGFYAKDENDVPTVEDFLDYYVNKGYDFPLIVCYEYQSNWNCLKIDNGGLYALEGYDNIKQDEKLVKKFTISSIELCEDETCEQLLDKNGNGLVDNNEKISFYYATVVISYYQCIDWDSNTWDVSHSYFGPKLSLSKWYGGLSYIVGPGVIQDVCKDRRPYIIVVFHNPNVNQNIKVKLRREG